MMTLLGFCTLVLAAPTTDVARAQRLYDDARYEDALAALGSSCRDSSSEAECERIRAFVLVALGEEADARSAFVRLLAFSPDYVLPADVSPKLRGVFEEAKALQGQVADLRLEAIELASERQPWMLRVRAPTSLRIDSVTVYIEPHESGSFSAVPLRLEIDEWVAQFRPASGEIGTASYYIDVGLPGGVTLAAGSSAVPKRVSVHLEGEAPDEIEAPNDKVGPTPGAGENKGFWASLPTWQKYGIIGGAAAIVVTGVVLGLVLSGGDDTGAIQVNVRFDEGP